MKGQHGDELFAFKVALLPFRPCYLCDLTPSIASLIEKICFLRKQAFLTQSSKQAQPAEDFNSILEEVYSLTLSISSLDSSAKAVTRYPSL